MMQEKRIKVKLGREIRYLLPKDAEKLIRNQENVIAYFLEKGFPKEQVEELFRARIVEE